MIAVKFSLIRFNQVQLSVSLSQLGVQRGFSSVGPWRCWSCSEAEMQCHQSSLFVQQYLQCSSSFFFSLVSCCLFERSAAQPLSCRQLCPVQLCELCPSGCWVLVWGWTGRNPFPTKITALVTAKTQQLAEN